MSDNLELEIGTKVLAYSKEENKDIYGTIVEKDFGYYCILSFRVSNKLSYYFLAKPKDIKQTFTKADINQIQDKDILTSIFGSNRITYRERIDAYRRKYEISQQYKNKFKK